MDEFASGRTGTPGYDRDVFGKFDGSPENFFGAAWVNFRRRA
jgi:hypothetical protein